MKILHTSDWHLGHTLYNYDRNEEQSAMLLQIVNIVKEHKPDLFLLCGDIYHTTQPSAAVQKMFTSACMNIHNANPGMTIVITAGNHDSGVKHEIFSEPWRMLNVFTIGNLNQELIYDHIIEIPGKGFVIAIPYVNERNIPDELFQMLLDQVAQRNNNGLPVVMTAHTTIKGSDFSGHDNSSEYVVGGIDSIDIDRVGEGYDYLALGHIHHEQFVHTGKHNVRYSGSPIPISFDENYAHSVSIVEIEKHGETPKVTKIEIENPRPLVSLPTFGTTTFDEAKKLLSAFPSDIPAYIRLNVDVEDFLPVGANDEIAAMIVNKQCRFCHINVKRKSKGILHDNELTVQEFQEEKPIDIVLRYADDQGFVFDDEMKQLFNQVVEMLENESRNE